ncbi:hypothetical protein ACHAXS_002198 [Conticribra weissflogii]
MKAVKPIDINTREEIITNSGSTTRSSVAKNNYYPYRGNNISGKNEVGREDDDDLQDEPTSSRRRPPGQQQQQQQPRQQQRHHQQQQTQHQYESLSSLLHLDDDASHKNHTQHHRVFSMEDDQDGDFASHMISSTSSFRLLECGNVTNPCKCGGCIARAARRTCRRIRRNYDSPAVISLGLLVLFVSGTILGCLFPSSSSSSTSSSSSSFLSWDVTSNVLGYTYFLSWTLSFYPQILTNHFHPSRAARGVSLDFVVWNMVGFACYAAYVTTFRYSDLVRREYGERFGEAAAAAADGDGEGDGASSVDGYANESRDWDGAVETNATDLLWHGGLPTSLLLHGALDALHGRIVENYLQTNGSGTDADWDDENTAYHDSPTNSANRTAFHEDGDEDDDDAMDTSFDDKGQEMDPFPVPQVPTNDVAFAWHALLLTIVIFVQINWFAERSHDEDESERSDMTQHFLTSDWLEVEEGEDMRVEDFGRASFLSSGSSGGVGSLGGDYADNISKERGFNGTFLKWGQRASDVDDDSDHAKSGGGHGEGRFTTPGEITTVTSPRHHGLSGLQPHRHMQTTLIITDKRKTRTHWTQRISPVTKILVSMLIFTCLIGAVFVAIDSQTGILGGGDWQWIDYLYFLSFVKVGITIVKYIPQVLLNYRRKSTSGWQIWNIILDFTGGTLSILQLIGDSIAQARDEGSGGVWTGIIGNPAKLGLGLVSIFFDHYVLYRENLEMSISFQGNEGPTTADVAGYDAPLFSTGQVVI